MASLQLRPCRQRHNDQALPLRAHTEQHKRNMSERNTKQFTIASFTADVLHTNFGSAVAPVAWQSRRRSNLDMTLREGDSQQACKQEDKDKVSHAGKLLAFLHKHNCNGITEHGTVALPLL